MAYEECKESLFGTPCTGTGDTSGTVLLLDMWDLVFDTLGTGATLKSAIHFAYSEFHFSCNAGLSIMKVKGDLICLHLNPTVKNKEHEDHCNETATGSGKPDDPKYWSGGVEKTAALLTSLDGSAFEETALVALLKTATAEEVFADQ